VNPKGFLDKPKNQGLMIGAKKIVATLKRFKLTSAIAYVQTQNVF